LRHDRVEEDIDKVHLAYGFMHISADDSFYPVFSAISKDHVCEL
jgi:hypothetical protein